jgi:ribosomal protein S18 acetylase RimI-like enzyme
LEIIRALELDQIPIVQKLAREIWEEHYGPILSSDQIDYMLNLFYSNENIQKEIKEGIYWDLIYYQNIAVGYISCKLELEKVHLSKIYLKSEMRGKGLGKIMFNHAIQITQNQQKKSVYLNVNKNNADSIEFYKRNGFEIIEEGVFDIGNGYVMDDYIMEKFL